MNDHPISIRQRLAGNPYPGRGILLGKTPDGRQAVAAYFIMGRSVNSRNRIFTVKNGAVYTEPYDEALVEDPSLIIYAAVRCCGNHLIVTNGDQTDTIYKGLAAGMSLAESLSGRSFEPDAPNFTPRISALATFEDGDVSYEMSILKSGDSTGTVCNRYFFQYPSLAGVGHFLHTYVCDGNPIPSFQGEPELVSTRDDIDAFAGEIWDALDPENRISLYVRYTDLTTGVVTSRLVNKNQGGSK